MNLLKIEQNIIITLLDSSMQIFHILLRKIFSDLHDIPSRERLNKADLPPGRVMLLVPARNQQQPYDIIYDRKLPHHHHPELKSCRLSEVIEEK